MLVHQGCPLALNLPIPKIRQKLAQCSVTGLGFDYRKESVTSLLANFITLVE